jgi:hypothetical protein
LVGPIQNTSRFAGLGVWLVSIAGAVILGLLVAMAVKDRRKELGILLSLGERKWRLVAQHAIEIGAIALLAFGFSVLAGQAISQKAGNALLSNQVASAAKHGSGGAARLGRRGSGGRQRRGRRQRGADRQAYRQDQGRDAGRRYRQGCRGRARHRAGRGPDPRRLHRADLSARHPRERRLTAVSPILEFQNVRHQYADSRRRAWVLQGLNQSFESGLFYTVLGPLG